MVIVHVDVHARDLVKSPNKPEPEGPKRKPIPKVPSWHLTADKAMKYITVKQETRRKEGTGGEI